MKRKALWWTEDHGAVVVGYGVGYDGMSEESDPFDVTLVRVRDDWKIATRDTFY